MARLDIRHAKSLTQAEWTGTVTVGNSAGATQSKLATVLVGPDEWNSLHAATFGLSKSDMLPVGFAGIWMPLNATNHAPLLSNAIWSASPIGIPTPINSGHVRVLGSKSQGLSNAAFSAASAGSFSKTGADRLLGALYEYSGANQWSSRWSTEISVAFTHSMTCASTVQTSRIAITQAFTLSAPSQYDASGGMSYGTSSLSGSTILSASTATGDGATSIVSALVARMSARRQWFLPLASRVEAGAYIWLYAAYYTSGVSSSRYAPAEGGITVVNNVCGAAWPVYKRPWSSDSSATSFAPDVPRGQLKTSTLAASSKVHVSDFSIFGNSVQDLAYIRFNQATL